MKNAVPLQAADSQWDTTAPSRSRLRFKALLRGEAAGLRRQPECLQKNQNCFNANPVHLRGKRVEPYDSRLPLAESRDVADHAAQWSGPQSEQYWR